MKYAPYWHLARQSYQKFWMRSITTSILSLLLLFTLSVICVLCGIWDARTSLYAIGGAIVGVGAGQFLVPVFGVLWALHRYHRTRTRMATARDARP